MQAFKTSTVVLFNKPYGVLSQFTSQQGEPTLADFIALPHIYPAGRLDKDSEGLLLLTDNGRWQQQITHPRRQLVKTYWVQVEGVPAPAALRQLRQGVLLNDGLTEPADVAVMAAPALWPRQPPIRFRHHIPTTWLQIQIHEGRNRQVRRMTAAVGFPTLRLLRYAIGAWTLSSLALGAYRVYHYSEQQFQQRLKRSLDKA